MTRSIEIRTATQQDLPALAVILENARSDWSLAILQNCFSKNYNHWMICVNNTAVGFIVIHHAMDEWEIMQLVISASYQRQGLATQLLLFAIEQAKKNAAKKLQLEVRASHVAAKHLYEKMGFRCVGFRKHYYADQEDAVLMDLSLS